MSKPEPATLIWAPPYLLVRKAEDRSEQDKHDLALLLQLAPARKRFREFNPPFSHLFARGITNQWARSRRMRRVNKRREQANAVLAKALKQLRPDKGDQRSVCLGWENGARTTNHVERNNRAFRLMQQTRYKRRKAHTLARALALALSARRLEHPLYQHNVRKLPVLVQEPAILARAA